VLRAGTGGHSPNEQKETTGNSLLGLLDMQSWGELRSWYLKMGEVDVV
jgi:hypothetical protein